MNSIPRPQRQFLAYATLVVAGVLFFVVTGLIWVINNIADCLAPDPDPCRGVQEHTRLLLEGAFVAGAFVLVIGVWMPWLAAAALFVAAVAIHILV